MRPEPFITARFEGAPSVLPTSAVFRCVECAGLGTDSDGKPCPRCDSRGHVRCSHPHLLLGDSFVMGDEVETLRYARCAGCGSTVRDPREDQAGEDAVNPFEADRIVGEMRERIARLHGGDDATVTPPRSTTPEPKVCPEKHGIGA